MKRASVPVVVCERASSSRFSKSCRTQPLQALSIDKVDPDGMQGPPVDRQDELQRGYGPFF